MRRVLLLAVLAAATAAAMSAAAAERSAVLNFVRDWARAWESQDAERYLELYAADARVGRRDRAQHAAHKRALFARDEPIEVRVGDVEVLEEDAGTVRVRFLQDYRSPSLSDFGRKELLLREEDGRWRILRETWQAVDGSIRRPLAEQLAAAREAEAAPPGEAAPAPAPEPVVERAGAEAPEPDATEGLEPLLGEGYAPPLEAAAAPEPESDLLALEPLMGETPGFLQPVDFPGLPGDIEDRTLVEEVVARVNGRVLTRSDFVERLEGRHLQLMLEQPAGLDGRLRGLVADTLALIVERWLLVQEAEINRAEVEAFWRQSLQRMRQDVGAKDLDEFSRLLQAEGMTLTTLREQVIANEVVQLKVTSEIDRSEERLREYHEANGSRYAEPARVSLRQILLPVDQPSDLPRAEAAAEEALAQLAAGRDWCRVHEVYGQGGGCGDIGTLALDDLQPGLREAAAGLPVGAVSKPLRSSAGLHLLQVQGRSETTVPPFEEVRQRVEADVLEEAFGRRLEDYLEELKATAVIEINPRYRELWDSVAGVGQ